MLFCSGANAQSAQDLIDDHKTNDAVLTNGMGYNLQRYSSMTGINKETVKDLVPIWSYSLATDRGEESQPLFYKGILYVTSHAKTVAVNAITGREIWNQPLEYEKGALGIACCGIVNRGAAIYEGKLFRTTLDAHVIALDIGTGEELWRSKATDYRDGYSFTVAPLVADGVVITGISGGEYGTRGFIDGWDVESGEHSWRRYTVASPDEPGGDTWPGETWKRGGAPAWLTGSYDPELGLVYWGTGNGGPWNAEVRKGDNLYIDSVLAIRPKTGELVWYYQFSPNDPYDYDGTNELILADMKVDGRDRKVVMQANRNGFFYVLDRTDGELLKANAFVPDINWADGIDMKSGRPIESELTKKMRATGEAFMLWPAAIGGKNWSPMAFDPDKGVAYANTLRIGMRYEPVEPVYRRGTFYFGINFTGFSYKDGARGYLRAIDPLTGKAKWEVPSDIPFYGGVLATAGGLVITGAQTGEMYAFDADDGSKLWEYQTSSGIVSSPITWQHEGKQYITIVSGIGAGYVLFGGDERLSSVPVGGAMTTFALH